jgi:hypothetical protein
MRFLVDNNLSTRLAAGMAAFGESVVHLQDHFPPDVQDVEWLRFVGEQMMFVLTRDERIRWNPAEKQAFVEFGVGAFFLGGKRRTHCELIRQLVRNWPRIKELAANSRRPFAFRVPPTGTSIKPISIA